MVVVLPLLAVPLAGQVYWVATQVVPSSPMLPPSGAASFKAIIAPFTYNLIGGGGSSAAFGGAVGGAGVCGSYTGGTVISDGASVRGSELKAIIAPFTYHLIGGGGSAAAFGGACPVQVYWVSIHAVLSAPAAPVSLKPILTALAGDYIAAAGGGASCSHGTVGTGVFHGSHGGYL